MIYAISLDVDNEFSDNKYTSYQRNQLDKLADIWKIQKDILWEIKVSSLVFPFRVCNYILDELINWNDVPNDPIFRLIFPLKGMLGDEHFSKLSELLINNSSEHEINNYIIEIRSLLNPHPSGQSTKNVPQHLDKKLNGFQHKYRETVLFFPSQSQYCHSYCTYCFRWAQFTGKQTRMSSNDSELLEQYLTASPEVTDLLITGGDPMVMTAKKLTEYLFVVLKSECSHIQNIRIGTKSLAFWPNRFIADKDANDMLAILGECVNQGKHVSIMAHFSHPRELSTDKVKIAIKRLIKAGVTIRTQAPLIKGINDTPEIWCQLWHQQIKLGLIPYYMFIERDTGPRHYFEVSLAHAFDIFTMAYRKMSGLCKTIRGPVMSTDPGKIEITGIAEIHGEKVFCLQFIQARNPDWIKRTFFAKYSDTACWIDDLKPAFGEDRFFWQ